LEDHFFHGKFTLHEPPGVFAKDLGFLPVS
jgi:hypothetical protein